MDSPATALPANEPRMEVLVGGACELHLDDGRVLRGDLQPAPTDATHWQLQWPDGTVQDVQRQSALLLRLAVAARPAAHAARRFTLALPALQTLTAQCSGTHSAAHGGLWLDVQLPDGRPEAWLLPTRTLPLLHWLPEAGTPRAVAPRNVAELWAALDRPHARRARHLGQALVDAGLLTPAALARALHAQTDADTHGQPHRPLGELLVAQGVLGAPQLAAALADWMGLPVVDLRDFTPDPEALRRVPRALAERGPVLPLALRDEVLVVAMADPWNQALVDELRFACEARVQPVAAAPEALSSALLRAYGVSVPAALAPGEASPDQVPLPGAGGAPRVGLHDLAAELVASGSSGDDQESVISESDNTLVRMINALITEAVKLRASDIHIETALPPRPVRVRLRIDGELMPCLELPARLRLAMVARLKIMADLDIAEHRKPQDGKISFARFGGPKVELRVVTVPTHAGLEDVVLRLLSGLRPMPLDEIGLAPDNLAALRDTIVKPYGLILICGPTGCGKTTTLHSVMRELNSDQRKIWTAEDPVEIVQDGLRQVQMNPRIGWTFANAMRTFLRADPDVIMIGEMRDEETARIAVEASLTGHLVLSTLHTNSAPESITRLLEIGLDPFMFSDSLLAILAQRLVRRLCPHCRVREPMDAQALAALAQDHAASANGRGEAADTLVERWRQTYGEADGRVFAWRHAGCPRCDHHGYRGRLGLHELMRADDTLREGIRHRAPAAELQAAALRAGMRTLRQDGIEKMLQGLTDLSEVVAATNQ
jgi:type II secretory ATPase GspE/PulE/Tfp pilus assembly ATPase PilB-like protein